MYEGVTEYFAGNVQVQYHLISPEEYIDMIQEKMFASDQYADTIPFTDLSKYALDKYHEEYDNVYQKGALIGMCLDIKLRKLSGGKYGLRNLLLDLSKRFGKDKPFKDDELFDVITSMTYPEIGEFFNHYVKRGEPLPYAEVLNDVGIIYQGENRTEDYSLGIDNDVITVGEYKGKPRLQITSAKNLNSMGRALGFEAGDVLLKINGENIPDLGPDFPAYIQSKLRALPGMDTIHYTVARKNDKGETVETELSTPVHKIEIIRRHNLLPNPDATQAQIDLRHAWLRP
jgi:predicted metalloprotease with PDZ domain